jgi:hypothetical protein
MASTYTQWIHHGESLLDARTNEFSVHVDDNTSLNEDACIDEVE